MLELTYYILQLIFYSIDLMIEMKHISLHKQRKLNKRKYSLLLLLLKPYFSFLFFFSSLLKNGFKIKIVEIEKIIKINNVTNNSILIFFF